MPSTFKLLDPTAAGTCIKPFGVRTNGVPSFECLRLLTGSLNIQQNTTSKIAKLRYCHLTQRPRRLSANIMTNTIMLAFDGDLTLDDVGQYLTKSANLNRDFWEELRSEICFCLYANKRENHVEAFLHLYRIYELISVALPLVYATKFVDFRKAVEFIKSLSEAERDKDLAILRHFSEGISKIGSFSDLSIDFPFHDLEMPARGHLREQLTSYVLNTKKIIHTNLSSSDPNDGISVEFKCVPSFIVSSRNRLFHNALSKKNFKLDFIQGSGAICSILVGPGLYWFSLVLVEILKAEASRYV